MATDPLALIRQYRVKYAQTPQTLQQAKPAGFMDAVVPPALALGATGILIGVLFDRKHGLFAGTSAALGLLGTAIGAGWGALRAGGTDPLKLFVSEADKVLSGGDSDKGTSPESRLETLVRQLSANYLSWPSIGFGGTGLVSGWFAGRGLGSTIARETLGRWFSGLGSVKKFGLPLPRSGQLGDYIAAFSELDRILGVRITQIDQVLGTLSQSELPLSKRLRAVQNLLELKIPVEGPYSPVLGKLSVRSWSLRRPLSFTREQIVRPGVSSKASEYYTRALPEDTAATLRDAVAKTDELDQSIRLNQAAGEVFGVISKKPGNSVNERLNTAKDEVAKIATAYRLEEDQLRIHVQKLADQHKENFIDSQITEAQSQAKANVMSFQKACDETVRQMGKTLEDARQWTAKRQGEARKAWWRLNDANMTTLEKWERAGRWVGGFLAAPLFGWGGYELGRRLAPEPPESEGVW